MAHMFRREDVMQHVQIARIPHLIDIELEDFAVQFLAA